MVEVYECARKVVEAKCLRGTAELWIRPVKFAGFDGEVLHLRAPNPFIKDWFDRNYRESILDEFKALSGCHTCVAVVVVEEESAPVPPQSMAPPHTPEVRPISALDARQTLDTYVVGPSNRMVASAARAVIEEPGRKYNPLFIWGPRGAGKTHVARAIAHGLRSTHPKLKVRLLRGEAFVDDYVGSARAGRMAEFNRRYRHEYDVLIVDEIGDVAGKPATEDALLHVLESFLEDGRQLVFTAEHPPYQIQEFGDRLRSRFRTGLLADVLPPEPATKVAIFEQKAREEALDLPREVAEKLASRLSGNGHEINGLVIRLAARLAIDPRPITADFVERELGDLLDCPSSTPTIDNILKVVAGYFELRPVDLKGARRDQRAVRARQIAMHLCRKWIGASYPEIGRSFGGKDHTTVMSACKRIDKLLGTDAATRQAVASIEQTINGNPPPRGGELVQFPTPLSPASDCARHASGARARRAKGG